MKDLTDDIPKIKEMISNYKNNKITLPEDELEHLCMSCWQLGFAAATKY